MSNTKKPDVDFEREKWRAQFEFDREKWGDEKEFRKRESDLKEREEAQKDEELKLKKDEAKRARWSPLVLAIIGASAAGLINAGLNYSNNEYQLALEDKKDTATLSLEEKKSEAARILEMIKTNDSDKAAENLKFLIDSGLIADQQLRSKLQQYIADRKPGTGPFLPTSGPAQSTATYSCNDVRAQLTVPQGYAVSTTQDKQKGECLFSVNGATPGDQAIACSRANAIAYVPSGNVASVAESGAMCSINVASGTAIRVLP